MPHFGIQMVTFLGVPKTVDPGSYLDQNVPKKCPFLNKNDLKTPYKCHIFGIQMVTFWGYQKRLTLRKFWTKMDQKSVHSCTKMTSKHLTNATFWDPNGHSFGCTKNGLGHIDSGPKRTKKVSIFEKIMTSKHLTTISKLDQNPAETFFDPQPI